MKSGHKCDEDIIDISCIILILYNIQYNINDKN